MSKEHLRWQAERRQELSAPESWLGLVGLFWLRPGANRVGGGADALVVLPGAPDFVGDLLWEDDHVLWRPQEGACRRLESDASGSATVVDYDHFSFFVIERDGRLAVRLRDRDWAASKPFAGLEYFDFSPDWCVEAAWQALSPPLRMEVPNVSGDLKSVEVAWQAVFSRDGQSFGLLPMSVAEDGVFFVFRDQTSGRQTYGAGAFSRCLGRLMERSCWISTGPITRPVPLRHLPPVPCRRRKTGCPLP